MNTTNTVTFESLPTAIQNLVEANNWNDALDAAIDSDPFIARWVAVYYEVTGDLTAKFGWLTKLEAANWSHDDLTELLFDRFEVEDFETSRRLEFFHYPPAWHLADDDELSRFVVGRMVEQRPEDVLLMNIELAKRLGQDEADRLAKLACRYLMIIDRPEVAEVVLQLGSDCWRDVITNFYLRFLKHSAPPRRTFEIDLLVKATLFGIHLDRRSGVETVHFLEDVVKIPWAPFDKENGKPKDPNLPIIVYRWVLKKLHDTDELPHREWMDDSHTTPEKVKERRVADIDNRLRRMLALAGFRFVLVREVDGRFEAVIGDKVFVEPQRVGLLNDLVQDGTEVIVPLQPVDKPTIRGRYRYFEQHLHPAAPPTPEMVAAVEADNHIVR